MPNLQNNCLELSFQKSTKHTRGMWLIRDTNQNKDNFAWEYGFDAKEVHGNEFNLIILKGNFNGRKHTCGVGKSWTINK